MEISAQRAHSLLRRETFQGLWHATKTKYEAERRSKVFIHLPSDSYSDNRQPYAQIGAG